MINEEKFAWEPDVPFSVASNWKLNELLVSEWFPLFSHVCVSFPQDFHTTTLHRCFFSTIQNSRMGKKWFFSGQYLLLYKSVKKRLQSVRKSQKSKNRKFKSLRFFKRDLRAKIEIHNFARIFTKMKILDEKCQVLLFSNRISL